MRRDAFRRELITKPVPHACALSLSPAAPFCAQQPECCKIEVQCWGSLVTLCSLRGPGAATQRTNLILVVQHPNFNLKGSSLPSSSLPNNPQRCFYLCQSRLQPDRRTEKCLSQAERGTSPGIATWWCHTGVCHMWVCYQPFCRC